MVDLSSSLLVMFTFTKGCSRSSPPNDSKVVLHGSAAEISAGDPVLGDLVGGGTGGRGVRHVLVTPLLQEMFFGNRIKALSLILGSLLCLDPSVLLK